MESKLKTERKIDMKNRMLMVSIAVLVALFAQTVLAGRLLTLAKALESLMPDTESIEEESRVMTDSELNEIKAYLGGALVHHQKGSKSEDVSEKKEYVFHFGIVNGERTEVGVVEEQPGKWGPVEYFIVLDCKSAKVKNIAVMSYREKRGRPIARHSFLSQFYGKGIDDPIQVRKDIRAISGATISSDATCFAVKKVIAMYEVIFLKNKLAMAE